MSAQFSPELTNEQLVALVQGSPLVHFASMLRIMTKAHKLEKPIPNILQLRISEAYQWCLENDIVPQIQILKCRQDGSSTFCTATAYHHARRFRVNGMIVGDEGSRTMKIWDMFRSYAEHDAFPWGFKFGSNRERAWFNYPDGTKGEWEHDTANDPNAGRSGTRHVIIFTEAALYAKTGARTDVAVISGALSSLATTPGSHPLVFMESTAGGSAGFFYDCWQQAATLDDCRGGRFGNGWIKIFAAWHEFPEKSLTALPEYLKYFDTDLAPREKRGKALYGWTAGQIAWRRMMIEKLFGGDEAAFDVDHPEDDESCFRSSGNPKFHPDGVARLEEMSHAQDKNHKVPLGLLEEGGEFQPQQPDGWLWMWVGRQVGRRYIGFLDPCTGEQSKGAKDPDAHGSGVIGCAFVDEKGKLHNDEVVAAIWVPPTGCRWPDKLIADRMKRLTDYYGGCMIVCETGNGLGVIAKLIDAGATLWMREKMDRINPGKPLKVPGWETNSATRDIWVNAIGDSIREQSFDCRFAPAVREMRTFVENDRGKAEAKAGKHDDWVSGIGIGLACKAKASVYLPQTAHYGGWGHQETGGGAFS